MGIEKVESFKASDGRIFKDKRQALDYESTLELERAINESPFFIYGQLDLSNSADFLKFINDNRELMLELLKAVSYE